LLGEINNQPAIAGPWIELRLSGGGYILKFENVKKLLTRKIDELSFERDKLGEIDPENRLLEVLVRDVRILAAMQALFDSICDVSYVKF